MTFPFAWNDKGLQPGDLHYLEGLFVRTVSLHLPGRVLHCFDVIDGNFDPPFQPEWQLDIERMIKKGRPRTAASGTLLFLPLWNNNKLIGGAIIQGNSDGVFHQHSHEILKEASQKISRELALLKEWSLDPVTGLLNGRAFHEELWYAGGIAADEDEQADPPEHSPFVLTLIEIFPRVKDAEQGLLYIAKSADYLKSLIGQYSPLYHFGAGVFAVLWREADLEDAMRMAEAVLRWLKREDFGPVRIGIADCGYGGNGQDDCPDTPLGCKAEMLLDQAWKALQKARAQGPYSLCAFASLQDERTKWISEVEPQLGEKLQNHLQQCGKFSLVLLHLDEEEEAVGDNEKNVTQVFPKKILSLVGEKAIVLPHNGREAYVLLKGTDANQAEQWTEKLRAKVRKATGHSLSAGITCHPSVGFKKGDAILNARKAILHTAFFGADTQVVFDAVSCNISGDVFHNRGDLDGAIREYRHGLKIDPENVNIHNSLGVSYAQMNQQKQALRSFEGALLYDADNFMALFNLGYIYLGLGRQEAAEKCFEKGLSVRDDNFDILLQLGRLRCQRNAYKEALPVLEKAAILWDPRMGEVMLGAVERFLGEAYFAQGKNKKAMASLEKATSLNPRDAGAMSRLGEIYALEKQGNDIAESLCRQAVELDANHWRHWYRLGFVQFKAGDFPEAAHALAKSARLDRKQAEVAHLLAKVYKKMGKKKQAVKLLERAKRLS